MRGVRARTISTRLRNIDTKIRLSGMMVAKCKLRKLLIFKLNLSI